MIVQCSACAMYFDDAYRLTYCPHDTFAANDGNNNFAHHPESYFSKFKPTEPDGFAEWFESQGEFRAPATARMIALSAWLEVERRSKR